MSDIWSLQSKNFVYLSQYGQSNTNKQYDIGHPRPPTWDFFPVVGFFLASQLASYTYRLASFNSKALKTSFAL